MMFRSVVLIGLFLGFVNSSWTMESGLDVKTCDAITVARQTAINESRELHILLGSQLSEDYIVELMDTESKRETTEAQSGIVNPFISPIRIFFTNTDEATVEKFSSSRTPIINGDLNNSNLWNEIVSVLLPQNENAFFNGPVDKIYFDVCSYNYFSWAEGQNSSVFKLLKRSGNLCLPIQELSNDTLRGQKTVSWNPRYTMDTSMYLYNKGAFFDSNFKTSDSGLPTASFGPVGPLTYDKLCTCDSYPSIGLEFRKFSAEDMGWP